MVCQLNSSDEVSHMNPRAKPAPVQIAPATVKKYTTGLFISAMPTKPPAVGTLRHKPPELNLEQAEAFKQENQEGLVEGDLCMARYAEDGSTFFPRIIIT